MVYYFVIGNDGQRYGPADVDSLVLWAREGRLIPETILVESGTEVQRRADTIVALAAVFTAFDARRVALERSEAQTLPARGARREAGRDAAQGGERPAPPVSPGFGLLPLERELPAVGSKSRVVAGLLGIFLGALGIHRFYLGYTGIGLLMLLITVAGGAATFVCMPGSGCGFVALWGFIEGVLCLCGSMRDANGRELA
ncbi:TM2 domain protein [Phycisphaerae bacterium RAS2]|nr:TM2 domain protein [Phycisphaerae bacterium RAS2]